MRSSSIFRKNEVVFVISSSLVKIKLHTENQLPRLPGSALKVPVGGFLPIIKSSTNSCWGWVGLWQYKNNPKTSFSCFLKILIFRGVLCWESGKLMNRASFNTWLPMYSTVKLQISSEILKMHKGEQIKRWNIALTSLPFVIIVQFH